MLWNAFDAEASQKGTKVLVAELMIQSGPSLLLGYKPLANSLRGVVGLFCTLGTLHNIMTSHKRRGAGILLPQPRRFHQGHGRRTLRVYRESCRRNQDNFTWAAAAVPHANMESPAAGAKAISPRPQKQDLSLASQLRKPRWCVGSCLCS